MTTRGTCIFPNLSFLWIYSQDWDSWIIWWLCCCFLWGPSILFSIVAAANYIPTNSVGGSLFSTASPAFVICRLFQFSSVQFSRIQLFATPWIIARQASPSITNSRSSLKFMSIESVMPSSHLILCCPLFLLPSIPSSIRIFSNESTLHMRWPKYWSFSFSIIPSNEHPGLISFRMDWLDLLAVQETPKSLLQNHSSKASIRQCSAIFMIQLWDPYITTGLYGTLLAK